MAAFSQKAEINQACLSVLFCSGFCQQETFLIFICLVNIATGEQPVSPQSGP
jgi:hypothetical protein